jgi:hypothetical protein
VTGTNECRYEDVGARDASGVVAFDLVDRSVVDGCRELSLAIGRHELVQCGHDY